MNKLIVIAGPTTSGKTQVSIDLAKELNTEIISCDSRQFFKEISIGTAKPSDSQLKEVKHHFISNISVNDKYSAGQYENDAIKLLDQLFLKNETVILTGGSGLYMDAVMYGFDEMEKVENAARNELNSLYKQDGIVVLQNMLAKLDPAYYKQVDLNNPHRLIRALEVILSTGVPYSEQRHGEKKHRDFEIVLIGLDVEREKLYERINTRVDEMMKQGLLAEVKSVAEHKFLNALQTVGYKELFDFLDGKMDLQEAVDLIKQNTRRFAKRQMTWLRRYNEIIWLKPETVLEMVKSQITNPK
jgi:tRNA dimethylallyltransferase